MRIVVDLQGAQTGSRYRGIGRYTMSLVKAMIRQGTDHEFIVVLNGLFPAGIEHIRAELGALLPQSQIHVWTSPGAFSWLTEPGISLRAIAEITREHFIRMLEPDVVLITSLFEGLDDGAILSIKKTPSDIPVACIFYDLTPLIMPDESFRSSPAHRRWLRSRIADLCKSDLLLAISESSRQEAISEIEREPDTVVNIFGGRDENFVFKALGLEDKRRVGRRFGLDKPFILYAGGLEPNKNLRRLVEAMSCLPPSLQADYQFVCVGRRYPGEAETILSYALDTQVRDMIMVTDYVSQDDLIDLYNACDLFVFPSLREGLGLPAIEAMACGAPTIVADRTSLPEIVDNSEALFDPESPTAIAAKIVDVLTDADMRERLASSGRIRAQHLTWQASAEKALKALERLKKDRPVDRDRRATVLKTAIFEPRKLKILAQKLDHHGDFFLALPALAKLRARYPDAQIDALVGSWNKDAAEASGLFDTIHTLDFFKAKSSERPSLNDAQLAVLNDLSYYDYALDLRRQDQSRFILFQIKAGDYFGYKTGDPVLDALLTSGLDIHPDIAGERAYFDETHSCEQIIKIVDALPFDVNDYVCLPEMGKRQPVVPGSVAIFPRVGLDARQWDSGRFGQLVDALLARPQINAVNIYAGKAEELDIIPLPQHEKLHLHCGLRFGELFTSLSGNQVCVGNNSFGVHLASYVGCKTIGIYSGHEMPQQWGPAFNGGKVVMVDAACAPCYLPDRQSCQFDMFCLEDISTNTVLDLVLAELSDGGGVTYRSDISAANPASAIRPLVDAINRHKSKGLLVDLEPEQKIAIAAAVAANFPERTRRGFKIYVDVSNFQRNVHVHIAKTHAEWRATRALIDGLRRHAPIDHEVVTIASGQYDNEFFAVPFNRVEEFSVTGRDAKIIRPLSGDIYLGIDAYPFRDAAQWDLLYGWRALGVTTAFLLPAACMNEWNVDRIETEVAQLTERFLQKVLHFDLLVTPLDRHRVFQAWVSDKMPPRERPIAVRHSALADHRPGEAVDSAEPASFDSHILDLLKMLIERFAPARNSIPGGTVLDIRR